MKNNLRLILVIFICFILLVGCNNQNTKEDNKKDNKEQNTIKKELTRSEIIDTLNDIDSAMVSLWNEVFCEVSWYTGYGTSSTGEVLDIDFVVFNAKQYYDDFVQYQEFINSLSDEYDNIKNAYDKAVEKADIIYNAIMIETPKANTEVTYKDDITLFNQYMDYFGDAIYDLDYE